MFWIGAAAGAFACLLFICMGFGVMFWQVAGERKRDGDKFKVEAERLYRYWESVEKSAQCQIIALERIAAQLKNGVKP